MIERLSLGDATNLAVDRLTPPPNVAALLVLGSAEDSSSDAELLTAIAARLASVQRFRQVLVPAPFGGGPPYWVDDPRFDAADHVDAIHVPAGEEPLLDAVADVATERLPRNRPQWRVRLLAQPDGQRAVVVVLHHVITDGLGGLAQLMALDDDVWQATVSPTPRPRPTHRELRSDARRRRRAAISALPAAMRAAIAGAREMGLDRRRPKLLDRSFINQPTGSTRRVAWISMDLDRLLEAARRESATLNDVVTAALAGVLGESMIRRGERPSRVVVSVPVSGRVDGELLGNQVGILPIEVPLGTDVIQRIHEVTRTTAAQKSDNRGSSATAMGALTRLLGAVGLAGFVIQHQRLVTTFDSNMRGPRGALCLAGHRVERIIPFAANGGNVGVSFVTCSYAGTLGISVIADPDVVPEYPAIAARLADVLERFASA